MIMNTVYEKVTADEVAMELKKLKVSSKKSGNEGIGFIILPDKTVLFPQIALHSLVKK
jgi:hypothetical protein